MKQKLQAGLTLDLMSTDEQRAEFEQLCAEIRALNAPPTPLRISAPLTASGGNQIGGGAMGGVGAPGVDIFACPDGAIVCIHRFIVYDPGAGFPGQMTGASQGVALWRNATTPTNFLDAYTTGPAIRYGKESAIVLRAGDHLLCTGAAPANSTITVNLAGVLYDVVSDPKRVVTARPTRSRPVSALSGSPTPTWPRTEQPGPATVPASGFGREGPPRSGQ